MGRPAPERLPDAIKPPPQHFDPADLLATLRPGDVLLVEGQTRVSTAIKYLTQSTWSHAALFVGDVLGARNAQGENLCFVEADIVEGVRAVPVSQYYGLHTRICRPVNVSQEQLAKLLGFICSKIGNRYDLKERDRFGALPATYSTRPGTLAATAARNRQR